MEKKEPTRLTNPVLPQCRAEAMLSTFAKYGYTMFRQQRAIYTNLREKMVGRSVIEVGSGDGSGLAIIERYARIVRGYDCLESNVKLASCLYPWIDFQIWDMTTPYRSRTADHVICVEALEHVGDPAGAINNLLSIATFRLWISTPNGRGKEKPPSNPYHVYEYSPEEMLELLRMSGVKPDNVRIMAWDDFRKVKTNTDVDPLVYRIRI